jgi:hypothetical protein
VDGFRYSVFGSILRCNIPIPGLPLPPSAEVVGRHPPIRLNLGIGPKTEDRTNAADGPGRHETLIYVSSNVDDRGQPALRVWRTPGDQLFHLVYTDETHFWLEPTGNTVWSRWSDRSSLENAVSYVLGPVLGLVLRLRGVVCLHASAVTFGDRCAAFVGPEGAGKSTTAAMFARLGHPIVSDDIVGLTEVNDGFLVPPAYPHLHLWPEAAQMVFGPSDAFHAPLPDWDKRRLLLGDAGTLFERRHLPLAAVYVLGDRLPIASPEIAWMSDREKLLALIANTYATNLIDRRMRAHEFAVLNRLISSTPVRSLHSAQDPARLDELCRLVTSDLAVPDPSF